MKLLDLAHTDAKAIVDDEDYERVCHFRWYRMPQTKTGASGYVMYGTTRKGKPIRFYLHRLIVGAVPRGLTVDHINGDVLDNRRTNLRIVSYSRNHVNRHRQACNNTSGVRGVTWQGKANPVRPWCAQIKHQRKGYNLGYFATIEEATIARQQGELKYFGELCPMPDREFKEWGGMEC